jgi:SAM-dependent methyltransferase
MAFGDIERAVAGYYAGKLREHGPSHRGVDWNSTESQLLRFRQFLRVIPPDGPLSVLDYGCGYGAFADYLASERGGEIAYQGYDLSDEMVEAARERSDRAGWSFTTDRGALVQADVTVASGIFNVKLDTDADRWREYTLETIADLAALSRDGLAFNMLTSYSDAERMSDDLYYGDPGFYFDWCKRHVSRHVALLHDYGLWEFTIAVRH